MVSTYKKMCRIFIRECYWAVRGMSRKQDWAEGTELSSLSRPQGELWNWDLPSELSVMSCCEHELFLDGGVILSKTALSEED